MTRALAWLRASWLWLAAVVGAFVAGLLLRRRTGGRALGRAEGRAREVADNLHGEAADLRASVEAARVRDAAVDAERAERVEAATRAVPEVPPPGWRRPPGWGE